YCFPPAPPPDLAGCFRSQARSGGAIVAPVVRDPLRRLRRILGPQGERNRRVAHLTPTLLLGRVRAPTDVTSAERCHFQPPRTPLDALVQYPASPARTGGSGPRSPSPDRPLSASQIPVRDGRTAACGNRQHCPM